MVNAIETFIQVNVDIIMFRAISYKATYICILRTHFQLLFNVRVGIQSCTMKLVKNMVLNLALKNDRQGMGLWKVTHFST